MSKNNAVAICVFKRLSVDIPVGVECRHSRDPGRYHAIDGGFVNRFIREVKHQQVVLRRCTAGVMPGLGRKLKVIRRLWRAQHHAVEAVMVLEAEQLREPEAVAVERYQCGNIVSRTRDAQVSSRRHLLRL